MPNIFITDNKSSVDKFLATISSDGRSRCYCLNLAQPDKQLAELLQKEGVTQLLPSLNNSEREKFLHDYVDLIGTINGHQNSLYWWATDISSKNRFTSRIPFLLFQFISAVQIIQKGNFESLVVFGADPAAVAALKPLLKNWKIDTRVSENLFRDSIQYIAGFVKRVLSVVWEFGKVNFRKILVAIYCKLPQKEKKDWHVIKTFIYDHSFAANDDYQDVFFGSLPDELKNDAGHVLILANILGRFRFCLQKIKHCKSHYILPLESFCSFFDIAKAYWVGLWYRTTIKTEMIFFGFPVQEIINHELSRTFCKIQPYHFLHYACIRRLTKKCDVKTFILTYENNPWEKMCLLAFKKYSPETRTVGYQHTVIPQASANMFRSQREKPVLPIPQKILTVGDVPRRIMERNGSYDPGTIEPACALRFEYLHNASVLPRQKRNRILMALEGIFDVYKMVNYVVGQLEDKSPSVEVIIRTHPVLPLSVIRQKLNFSIHQLKNFKLSQSTLNQDLEATDLVVYWGSTVALEAISRGRPVIHFETGGPLSFDPLFELLDFKWAVREGQSLPLVINEIYSLNDREFEVRRNTAMAYLKGYFHPVSAENIRKFR